MKKKWQDAYIIHVIINEESVNTLKQNFEKLDEIIL